MAALGARLPEIAGHARAAHDRIDRYGIERGLGPLHADLLWHRRRGVPLELLPDAQGIGYETKKQRLGEIRHKTDHEDIDLVLAEALGELDPLRGTG